MVVVYSGDSDRPAPEWTVEPSRPSHSAPSHEPFPLASDLASIDPRSGQTLQLPAFSAEHIRAEALELEEKAKNLRTDTPRVDPLDEALRGLHEEPPPRPMPRDPARSPRPPFASSPASQSARTQGARPASTHALESAPPPAVEARATDAEAPSGGGRGKLLLVTAVCLLTAAGVYAGTHRPQLASFLGNASVAEAARNATSPLTDPRSVEVRQPTVVPGVPEVEAAPSAEPMAEAPPEAAKAVEGPAEVASAEPAPPPANPHSNQVRLEITPPDAKVLVRGTVRRGSNPYTFEIPKGRRITLEIVKSGYIPRRVEIDGSKPELSISLSKRGRGREPARNKAEAAAKADDETP